jgi:hypothetical protein
MDMPKAVAVNRIGLDDAQITNGGEPAITLTKPYRAKIEVVGVAPLLFHRWNVEAVAEKGAAAKGSKAKKTDNIESYVYRTDDGYLGIPGVNFTASLQEAGRYESDPRSPRKSLRDLLKAAVIPLDAVAMFSPKRKEWDYEDKRRAPVQRQGITRVRPAMKEGWKIAFTVLVTLPQYVTPELLTKLANSAGLIAGLCDHRPTYGRFTISAFEILE